MCPLRSAGDAAFREARRRTLDEARMLADLESPCIVQVLDAFEENGTVYLVMELLEGETLAQALADGPLESARVRNIAADACDALSVVHDRGLLHRDIKPDNLMLTPTGRTVLIDFGSARPFTADRTLGHTRILTLDYAAPEMFGTQARFGPAADIFGLGATLYHALTGTPPPSVMDRMQGLELPDHPALHEPPGAAVMQALAIAATDRPPTAAAFRDLCPHTEDRTAGPSAQGAPAAVVTDNTRPPDRVLRTDPGPRPDAVRSLLFHPTRNILAAAAGRSLYLWLDGHPLGDRGGHPHHMPLRYVMWDAGSTPGILTMDAHSHLRRWDVNGGDAKSTHSLNGVHTSLLDVASTSRNGDVLVLGYSPKGRMHTWNVSSGAAGTCRILRRMRPRTYQGAAFTPSGRMLVAWNERRLHVWDPDGGGPVHALMQPKIRHRYTYVSHVSFSPDEHYMITTEGNHECFHLWDLKAGLYLRNLGNPAGHSGLRHVGHTWHPFNFSCANFAWRGAGGCLFHPLTGKRQDLEFPPQWKGGGNARSVFSPNGLWLAAVFGCRSPSLDAPATVFVWDARTGRLHWRLRGCAGGHQNLAFNADGTILAAGGTDGGVCLWDATGLV